MKFRRFLCVLPLLALNAFPQIVINEIHYAPLNKASGSEFIELYNRSGTEVDLSNWSISDGVEFQFPPGASISAHGYFVITERANSRADTLGPWTGVLSNQGDSITLKNASGATIDNVSFQAGFSWPIVGDTQESSIELINPDFDNDLGGNWRPSIGSPTPGAQNSVFSTANGPQIRQVDHSPKKPHSNERVIITAKVTDPQGMADVSLLYQVVEPGDYLELSDPRYASSWTTVTMHDDGLNGDAAATDSIYTVILPAELQMHRRLIRYRITAADSNGASVTVPYPEDPQPNFAYYVYDGVPEFRAAIEPGSSNPTRAQVQTISAEEMSRVPVYQLIARNSAVEDATWKSKYTGSDYKWWGTLVYDGQVYDHIRYRARGGVWRYAMGKNMWKFDFNRGHDFEPRDNYGSNYKTAWTKLNLSAIIQQGDYKHRGEQGMFESVGFRLFNLAGVEAPHTHWITLRIVDNAVESPSNQYNGDFWGLYLAVEQEDGRFLDEHDLPDGNLYKMESGTGTLNNRGLTAATDGSDLASFIGTYRNGTPTDDWWRQNLDLNKYYSYQAIVQAIHHYDICYYKNYFYFLDPLDSLWSVHPWDLDLTWADNMYDAGCGGTDEFKDRVLGQPPFNLEYYNRLREIRDLLYNSDQAYKLVDEYAGIVKGTNSGPNILAADRAMWDYNPVMANGNFVNTSKAGQGKYYQFPLESANDPNLKGDFDAVIAIMKNYVTKRGKILDALSNQMPSPSKPTIQYTGANGYPINGLQFSCSAFSGPSAFAGMQWRVGEIRSASPGISGVYEIKPVWESGTLANYTPTVSIPGRSLKVGHQYRARVRFGDVTGAWSHWSDPVEFNAAESDNALALQQYLKITEVMYNPPGGSDLEFIELLNSDTNSSLNISGVAFAEGIDFALPDGAILAPSEYALVVKSDSLNNFSNFRAYYQLPSTVKIFGPYSGSLNNDGERLTLKTARAGTEIETFIYNDSGLWPIAADGAGHSLVPVTSRLITANATTYEYPGNWRASAFIKGSPGKLDPEPTASLMISESAANTTYSDSAHPEYASNDWIEILNQGPETELTDYYLSDDAANLKKWRLPSSSLGSGARVSFDEITGFHSPITSGFGLTKSGEDLFLAYLPGTDADRVVDSISYKGQAPNRSWGRSPDGTRYFVPLTPSRDAANPAAEYAIQLQEIMYHPKDESPGVDNSWAEYISIYNHSGSTYLFQNTNGTFRISGGVSFNFPGNFSLVDGESVVLTSFDPANITTNQLFRTRYQIPDSVKLLGPYSGKLANSSDRITLELPVFDPDAPGTPFWSIIDEVVYSDQIPWQLADGNDLSLHRITSFKAGNDPANWAARAPTPGRVLLTNADSDGDGMLDDWENANGLNPFDPEDASQDPDHDGLTNLQESMTGTNPQDAASTLALRVAVSSSEVQFSFSTVSGKGYQVQYRDSLDDSGWKNLTTISGDGSPATFQESIPAASQRFYRIELMQRL